MRLYAIAGALALAVYALLGTHLVAYKAGKNSGKIEQLRAAVDAHQKREGIDHEVSKLDRVGLCVELGGVLSDCEQLRGLEEAAFGE